MKLCVPLSAVFLKRQKELLGIVQAVSFKEPRSEVFSSKSHFLESSFGIADEGFPEKLETSGYLEALRSGKFTSFAFDIGPACQTVQGRSPNGFPRAIPLSTCVSDERYQVGRGIP